MRLIFLLILSALLISCKKSKNESIDLKFLNGYWEIDYVIMSNGTKKEFNFNEYVDYFETTNASGFKTKVKPKIGGTYSSNFKKINYSITTRKDTLIIKYSSPRIIHEKLFMATEKQLGFKAENGNLYYYKPFTPIIIKN